MKCTTLVKIDKKWKLTVWNIPFGEFKTLRGDLGGDSKIFKWIWWVKKSTLHSTVNLCSLGAVYIYIFLPYSWYLIETQHNVNCYSEASLAVFISHIQRYCNDRPKSHSVIHCQLKVWLCFCPFFERVFLLGRLVKAFFTSICVYIIHYQSSVDYSVICCSLKMLDL